MIGNVVSNMMVKPGQSPLFDTPAAHGLAFEDVRFSAEDGTSLQGWLLPGSSDRVIVQSHFGVQCNRGGWTPRGKGPIKPWKTDIRFLRQATYLVEQGYSVLMYDFRGHGESETGPIPWVSWGPEEAKDVVAAVDFIGERFPSARVGLLSICMGSAATTYAYGREDGLASRSSIKALIAVQPLRYRCFMDALGMPGFMARAGERVSTQRLGFDLGEPNFVDHAAAINVPTRVVQNRNDPWTQLDMVEAYYQALAVEKDLSWLDLEASRFAAYDHLGTHPAGVLSWFDSYL
ncbi:MAG: alpha/beta fold hydrolase [Pseudomonadota bacterium]